jgi:4-amino-4-deoxy-L-arabinose transferase-like glycosyltransferase
MKEKLLFSIALVWTVTVIGYWSFFHFFGNNVLWLELALIPLVLSVIFGVSFLYLYFFKKQTHFTLTVSPAWLILIVWFLAILFFTFSAFIQVNNVTWGPLLDFSAWLPSVTNFSWLLAQTIVLLFLMSVTTWCFGKELFSRLPHASLSPLLEFLFIQTLGIFSLVFLAVLLGLFNILTPLTTLTLALLGIFHQRKKLFLFLQQIFQRRSYTFDITSQNFWLLIILLVFATLTLVDSIKPMPTGYDDMTYYMNKVNLMTQTKGLIFGGYPFSFEMLSIFFQSLSHFPASDLLPALLVGVFTFGLAGLALYGFTKEYTGHSFGALVVTTLFVTLSMSQSLTVREVKPDTLLFFFCILFLWSLLLWYRQKNILFLGGAAFVFGLACATKMTAVFFVPGVALALLLLWRANKTLTPLSYKTFLKLLALFLLPLSIWFLVSLQSYLLTPSGILKVSNPLQSSALYEVNALPWSLVAKDCPGTPELDLSRYQKQDASPVASFLWLPWDLTMNTRVGYFVTEIGFLFLILLPIILLRTLLAKSSLSLSNSKTDLLLCTLAVGYWGAWLLLGKYIPWYAFPGLIFLLLPLAKESERKEQPWRIFFSALLWLTLIASLMVRLQYFTPVANLQYLSGNITPSEFPGAIYPDIAAVASIINTDPQSRAIVPVSKIRYLITNNHERLITDERLGLISCLQHNFPDESSIIEVLRDFNISYIYITQDLVQSSAALGESEKERVQTLLSFAARNLTPEPSAPGLYRVNPK